MTILFYIVFAMVSAVMFTAGAIIAYIEGEKELTYKYNRGIKNNGKNPKKQSKKAI